MNLVIVESPNKCDKIQKILGQGWKVTASYGHFRDLPAKSMGVKAPDFKPEYVIEDPKSKKRVAQLRKDVKAADCVYLATDPDREGEAIAWHLLDELKLKNYKRIAFNQINKQAVLDAVNNPTTVDFKRVQSQEARRVLDRLVGYRVSGPLSKSVSGGLRLSAGRVQSPALRLVVERDRAIANFQPTDHFGVRFHFEHEGDWYADWITKPFIVEPNEYILDRGLAERIAKLGQFEVVKVEDANLKKKPPAPFVTTTLIKAACAKFRISTERVMELAQKLFEGSPDSEEGYITYHRTDFPNISDEAYERVIDWAENNFDPELMAPTRNVYPVKGDAQEAHEAIRPANFEVRDLESGDDLLDALYDLIWDRTVASQMLPALYKQRKVVLKAKQQIDGQDVLLAVNFRIQTFKGWMELTKTDDADTSDKDSDEQQMLPNIREGLDLDVLQADIQDKRTKPPQKFTEAKLVEVLEKLGIGRPATYASIMGVLKHRNYMTMGKKSQLSHTDTGAIVVDQLLGRFDFLDYEFTKAIEEQLDDIAQGRSDYQSLVAKIDAQLTTELSALPEAEPDPADVTDFDCPNCDAKLARRQGQGGSTYFGCTRYHEGCKTSLPDVDGQPFYVVETKDYPCDSCGEGYLVRRPGKFGFYWPCNNKSCKNSKPDNNGVPGEKKSTPRATGNKAGMACPTCGSGELVERKFKNKPVLGCSTFPACKHFEWVK